MITFIIMTLRLGLISNSISMLTQLVPQWLNTDSEPHWRLGEVAIGEYETATTVFSNLKLQICLQICIISPNQALLRSCLSP